MKSWTTGDLYNHQMQEFFLEHSDNWPMNVFKGKEHFKRVWAISTDKWLSTTKIPANGLNVFPKFTFWRLHPQGNNVGGCGPTVSVQVMRGLMQITHRLEACVARWYSLPPCYGQQKAFTRCGSFSDSRSMSQINSKLLQITPL